MAEYQINEKGAVGHIVRIVGPVVDVEFPKESMPSIYNALTVDGTTPAGDIHVVMEVQMHLPGDLVRAVAMSSTDGMVRGMEVQDTGNPIMMPMGEETLGRIWNVIGEPVDSRCPKRRPTCPFTIRHLPTTP